MAGKAVLAICGALLAIGGSFPALAQDAAETAVILSGAGQPAGRASRSLGSAISGSINAASAQIRSVRNAEPTTGGHQPRTAGDARAITSDQAIASDIDMLEGTDAPTYRLGNGASIRVSGTFIQDPGTMCSRNCPADSVRSGGAH